MNFSELVGTWSGTNGFRLMPGDRLDEFAATACVSPAAGGHLAVLTYTWRHPDDGPQDGVILLGPAGAGEDAVVGTWGDSWHQKPDTMVLSGRREAEGGFILEGEYAAGWGWRVRVEATAAGELLIRMDNVIPAGQATTEMPAGPYPVMLLNARRS